MEEAPSKHRNLQHLLSAGVKERAFHLLGEGNAAGLKVLELRQREMQELFGKIFGVATKSSNNEWLRSKLLQAVGLPPRWRPAPAAPQSPRREARPGEFSRFGRRLRTTVSPAMTAAEEESDGEGQAWDDEEEQRTRKRSRGARSAGSAGSDSGSSRGGSPAAASADVDTSSGGSAAVMALQARATAAFMEMPASQPQALGLPPSGLSPQARLAAQHYSPQQPGMQPPGPQQYSHQQPGMQLAAQRYLQHQSAMPGHVHQYGQQQPAVPLAVLQPPTVRSVSLPVPPQCAPGRSSALAALLSDPTPGPHSPSLLPGAPHVPSLLALPSLKLASSHLPSCTISAQLHTLYTDWEDGLVSFGPM